MFTQTNNTNENICLQKCLQILQNINEKPAEMIIEAAPGYELLVTFVTDERPFTRVAADVLLQMAESKEMKTLRFFRLFFI